MNNNIRTRFAPSPTGFMHVGGVRTALFGWLFAKANNGSFVLRIEDTDKSREVSGSVEHIYESLMWLGLQPDEGPKEGGDLGPYTQSERLETYRTYAQKLIDAGLAYADPFSTDQVREFRAQAEADKRPFLYRNHRPNNAATPNDWYGTVPIRFKTTSPHDTRWFDVVRGELRAGAEAQDDFIIVKSDGFPTYNFAHIVDDHEMQISHVIRGEEFISSMPNYLNLYEALEIKPPKFVTVPPILGPSGTKKLSKRDGAKDVLDYRAEGFLFETILNFLASLGWNDGTEKEIYSQKELIASFTLKKIQRSGARFDPTKLEWMEWQHRQVRIEQDPATALESLGYDQSQIDPQFARLALSKSRSVKDFNDQYEILSKPGVFELNQSNLQIIDDSLDHELAITYIDAAIDSLECLDQTSEQSIEQALRACMDDLSAQPRAFLNLIRWSITNRKVSPNLFAIINIIGVEQTITRLEATKAT